MCISRVYMPRQQNMIGGRNFHFLCRIVFSVLLNFRDIWEFTTKDFILKRKRIFLTPTLAKVVSFYTSYFTKYFANWCPECQIHNALNINCSWLSLEWLEWIYILLVRNGSEWMCGDDLRVFVLMEKIPQGIQRFS